MYTQRLAIASPLSLDLALGLPCLEANGFVRTEKVKDTSFVAKKKCIPYVADTLLRTRRPHCRSALAL